jgi:hypothetical protein
MCTLAISLSFLLSDRLRKSTQFPNPLNQLHGHGLRHQCYRSAFPMFDVRQLARNGHRWQRNSKPSNNRIRSIFIHVLYRRFPIFACRPNACSWRRFSRLLEFFYLSCAQRQCRAFSFSCPPFQQTPLGMMRRHHSCSLPTASLPALSTA